MYPRTGGLYTPTLTAFINNIDTTRPHESAALKSTAYKLADYYIQQSTRVSEIGSATNPVSALEAIANDMGIRERQIKDPEGAYPDLHTVAARAAMQKFEQLLMTMLQREVTQTMRHAKPEVIRRVDQTIHTVDPSNTTRPAVFNHPVTDAEITNFTPSSPLPLIDAGDIEVIDVDAAFEPRTYTRPVEVHFKGTSREAPPVFDVDAMIAKAQERPARPVHKYTPPEIVHPWSAGRLDGAITAMRDKVLNLEGNALDTFMIEQVIPAHQNVIAELQALRGQKNPAHVDDMMEYNLKLRDLIKIGREKLGLTPVPTPAVMAEPVIEIPSVAKAQPATAPKREIPAHIDLNTVPQVDDIVRPKGFLAGLKDTFAGWGKKLLGLKDTASAMGADLAHTVRESMTPSSGMSGAPLTRRFASHTVGVVSGAVLAAGLGAYSATHMGSPQTADADSASTTVAAVDSTVKTVYRAASVERHAPAPAAAASQVAAPAQTAALAVVAVSPAPTAPEPAPVVVAEAQPQPAKVKTSTSFRASAAPPAYKGDDTLKVQFQDGSSSRFGKDTWARACEQVQGLTAFCKDLTVK